MHRSVLFGALVLNWAALSQGVIFADERDDFFEAKIRPVLVGTCFRCHGAAKISGELLVDSREALLQGGESGPAIEPSNPEMSLLIQAIRRQKDVAPMPPDNDKGLRPDQVADFETWIKNGAVWPASTKFLAANDWAFEPVREIAPPEVNDNALAKTSVDSFILAKQEAAGMNPAPPADKLALIRRATFDLTGLPPTSQEIDAFLGDSSPQAFETVVDRLLASHSYGEHWGRHWLDIVRYADTAGETADYPVPLAWRYRNYVIDSFNSDKPFDEFLREQIAGDILADQSQRERYAERVIATGYLAISRRFGFDSENYQHLTIQDSIDTLGQSIMGLSLGCARCHDHKFDPISVQDYYALYGISDSSRYPFPGSEQKQQVRSLAPLLPPQESQLLWREFNNRVAQKSNRLAQQNQSLSGAVLRSLHDIDGDFELQAPAAGGSNGVLVSPWLYEGRIAVTSDAQSPFKNLNAMGRNGISISADAGPYRIRQAVNLRLAYDDSQRVYVNLDFRVIESIPSTNGKHCFSIGSLQPERLFELGFSASSVSLLSGAGNEKICAIKPGQWYNLQLVVDLVGQTVSVDVGVPGAVIEHSAKPFASTAARCSSKSFLRRRRSPTQLCRPPIRQSRHLYGRHSSRFGRTSVGRDPWQWGSSVDHRRPVASAHG